ncbi:MAG TPA: outer membrane protein transport protein [Candidatus Eisenbacteria bacterium]
MRTVRAVMSVAAAWIALVPAPVRAAGYSIYEQGAAVLGMGGAGVASVSDASAVFYNPAAISRLEGTQVLAGGTLLSPATSFSGVAPYPGYGVTEEMTRQNFFPPTFYATRRFAGEWAMGAGFNSPYGLGIEWKNPDTFTGRYIVTKADVRALQGNLSLAWSRSPKLSFGAGADVLYGRALLHNREQAIIPGGGGGVVDVAKVDLESDYKPGWGWNAAVLYQPEPEWKVALSYHSKIVVHSSGNADFTQIFTGDAALDAAVTAGLPPHQGVSTVLRFPGWWTGAVAVSPEPQWTLEADVNFFEWSVFEDLPIHFHQTPSADVTLPENYNDSWQFRLGVEHRLESFTYRVGYYYDQAAAPSESVTPILPDASRNGITAGLGFKLGAAKRLSLDLYELALFFNRRSTLGVERDGYNGEYKSYVNAAGVGLSYHW